MLNKQPTLSPDLISLEYFLKDYLPSEEYKPQTIEALKESRKHPKWANRGAYVDVVIKNK